MALGVQNARSLPYRQLRNVYVAITLVPRCSLPYRQLRNVNFKINDSPIGSLPYRQLRKRIRN